MRVILFGAAWCPSCVTFKPEVESVCAENDVDLKYLDVDEYFDIAGLYAVKTIPAIVVIDDLEQDTLYSGSCSREELIERLVCE